jgi:ribonuclease Y
LLLDIATAPFDLVGAPGMAWYHILGDRLTRLPLSRAGRGSGAVEAGMLERELGTMLVPLVIAAVVLLLVGIAIGRVVRPASTTRSDATGGADRPGTLARGAAEQAEQAARALIAGAEEQAQAREKRWDAEEAARRTQLEAREADIERQHRQLADRDRALARRDQLLRTRDEEVDKQRQELETQRQELLKLQNQAMTRLEEVSGLSREEATRRIVEALRQEARVAAAAEVRQIKEELQRNADWESQKIMALAIERLASDFSAERPLSQVPLPDNGLRGRIIGAEGRNIRAFEKLTGMQLLFEDDAKHVTISGFNPIRREVARRSLERLIEGGAIHPRKIQLVVGTVTKKLEQELVKAGREAVEEFGFKGVHPEMIALLGRLKYRTSYGQNVLEHVREVGRLCGMMAAELGLDQKLAQRAGLFHDIGKAVDFEREGTHPEIGGELGRRYNEPPVVVNAIESHHDDCEVIHPISVLVAAADALSGARPGARRRTTVDYIQRVAKLEELAHSFAGVDSVFALQAGRELRVIVQPNKLDDDRAALLAHDLSQRIQAEMDYPGRIKVTVIREVRAQAVAS